jgi:Arc/MetJ-type ribon-helix-helix transcriptional regulator
MLPDGVRAAIKKVARHKFMSSSEYVRQAVLARLESDGVRLNNEAAA